MSVKVTFSKSKRLEAYEKTGGRCAYCGRPLDLDDFHIDHITPLNSGGPNDLSNLFASCRQCNLTKNARNLDEWREYVTGHIAQKLCDAGQELLESRFVGCDKDKLLGELFAVYRKVLDADVVFYFERVGKE